MYSNKYECPSCGHKWKLKGRKDETSVCKVCEQSTVLETWIFPYESVEVDYDEI